MSSPFELPPAPPIVVRGDSVTYASQAAVDALRLMDLGIAELERQAHRAGVAVPERFLMVRHAVELATADMRTSTDVRSEPTSAVSEPGSRWVGVGEAAALLGVGARQARRRIQAAGGTKTRNGWRVQEHVLRAEIELRRTA